MTDKKKLSLEEIKSIIPHRYPMLLVDYVSEYVSNEYLVAHKCVTQCEPHLQGHFPNNPIVPGVFQIESMAQACAILAGIDVQGLMLLVSVTDTRFFEPIVPGMVMDINVHVKAQKRNIQRFACHVTVDGKKMSESVITGALT